VKGSVERDDGTEPDPRFTFANERTLLAWIRTSLALIAAGVATLQFLDVGSRVVRDVVAAALILTAGAMAIVSQARWERNQRALRRGEPLPASRMPRLFALGVAALALVALAVAVVKAAE